MLDEADIQKMYVDEIKQLRDMVMDQYIRLNKQFYEELMKWEKLADRASTLPAKFV